MSRIVRDAFNRREERMADASRARMLDPQFNYQTTLLRHMLDLADMVMEDEGVPEQVRAKVVRGILYGYPNPADAELRIELNEELVTKFTDPTGFPAEGWYP